MISSVFNVINIGFSSFSSGMGKDNSRGKSSFSQAYKQKKNLAVGAETEKQEESLLTDCNFYLSSIFVHWEPVFPLFDAQLALPKGNLDPSGLACDTTHLLTKWSLRCLVEVSYDENRTREFLHWLEKSVIKHKEIIAVVLLDPGMKADLLRLYHRAFETQSHPNVLPRLETLQQFTKIMICLLETNGHLPELHQTVTSACLPEATHDPCRCGKSLAPY